MFELKKYFSSGTDRHRAVTAAALALMLLCVFLGGIYLNSKGTAVKELSIVKLKEAAVFEELKVRYLNKRLRLDYLNRKTVGAESRSMVAVTEEIGREAGIFKRITGLKSLGQSAGGGYIKSSVELRVERIELDELVNLLYLIEFNQRLFVIKDFTLKSRFDAPNLMDVSMKITRVKKSL